MNPSGSEAAPESARASVAPPVDLRRKRILIAKPGLDGHDVGAKVIALALRDAGADVIYTGLRRSADHIARVAVDEGVDAVGLSILSGSHLDLVAQTREALRSADADDVVLFVGGTIPASDHEPLRALGVAEVFTAEDRLDDVVRRVAERL